MNVSAMRDKDKQVRIQSDKSMQMIAKLISFQLITFSAKLSLEKQGSRFLDKFSSRVGITLYYY